MSTVASRPAPASSLNAMLCGFFGAASLLLFLVMPAWLLPANRWWGLLLVPIALSANTMWSLIHEAIHGHLFAARRRNNAAGRLLCVLYGAPFRALRVAHLLHHRYSRTRRDRTEVYDPACTSRLAAAAGFYVQLLGGMYLLEVLSSIACLLPKRAIDWLAPRLEHPDSTGGLVVRAVREPRALREMRLDMLAILVVFGSAIWLYGANVWMLATVIAVRAALVSIADNSYHYATRLEYPRLAMNAHAPRWVAAALLHFNLHGVHHRHPHLPWSALQAQFEREDGRTDIDLATCFLRQLRGPIALGRLPV
ncbi:MAG: fatty acid desaturase [Betaproteobacteria bacterium]|nr:fatty acid desaturase [Betaproteobacteria bacterium]